MRLSSFDAVYHFMTRVIHVGTEKFYSLAIKFNWLRV
jgi:hypothetical protein